MPLPLMPVEGVRRLGDDQFLAEAEPWLEYGGRSIQSLAGRLVTITYRLSLLDEPVRPVFRFVAADDAWSERIAPGPIVGAGRWTGRIPAGTRRLLVSPTNRRGPFAFRVESIVRRAWPALLREGLRQNRRSTRSTVLTTLIGWRPEADNNLDWAIGAHDLAQWSAWKALRARAFDPAFDRPRFDWSRAAPIDVVIDGGGAVPSDLDASIRALQAQVFPRWRAFVMHAPSGWSSEEARVTSAGASDRPVADPMPPGTLTGILRAGDRLEDYALAYLAEQANRYPEAVAFYGDTEEAGRPTFRPGWDPHLGNAGGYAGGASFLRDFGDLEPAQRQAFVREGRLPATGDRAPQEAPRPLHRVIATCRKALPAAAAPPLPVETVSATAAIIIPTKDHPALLARVVASIRAHPQRTAHRIVVVDNGSTDPGARALLDDLRASADATVLAHPGPFNFSLMCNEAAASAREAVLVFLNDDTEVRSADWLDRLAALALAPGVGAVGAKLTYPDGRLQHVGVLLGMGGSAGHFGALAPQDDPGWAARNGTVHAVTAVTGACLGVARERFEAVGGFDATHLPIELSDVDLCLKLNERSWQTMLDPFVHLMHEESVSRGGATFRRLDLYESQRSVFLRRWRDVLRDDPLFHPGLSLYSHAVALG